MTDKEKYDDSDELPEGDPLTERETMSNDVEDEEDIPDTRGRHNFSRER